MASVSFGRREFDPREISNDDVYELVLSVAAESPSLEQITHLLRGLAPERRT